MSKESHIPRELANTWGTSSANPFSEEDKLKYQENVYFYVVRCYSGTTAKRHLIEIMSRRITRYFDAVDMMDFEKSQDKNKNREYMIITIPADKEVVV
jgi:hypothetical protein